MVRAGKYIYLVLIAIGTVYFALTRSQLPPRVAVHFGAGGAPNGWSTVSGYFTILGFVGFLLPLSIVLLVTYLSARAPENLNLPHGLARLEPEYAAGAAGQIQAYIWWLPVLMEGLVLVMHAQLLAANHRTPPHLDTSTFLLSLACFLVGLVIWIAGWWQVLRPENCRDP